MDLTRWIITGSDYLPHETPTVNTLLLYIHVSLIIYIYIYILVNYIFIK